MIICPELLKESSTYKMGKRENENKIRKKKSELSVLLNEKNVPR